MKTKLAKTIGVLSLATVVLALSGCQAGKLNLPQVSDLAFWKKSDTLASRYVEPPAHQFTPSDAGLASADGDLPPLPPDVEKTAESFEAEVSRSYEQLARQTNQARERFEDQVRQLESNAEQVVEDVTPKFGSSAYSNPLTPRHSLAATNNQGFQPQGNEGSQSRNEGSAPRNEGSAARNEGSVAGNEGSAGRNEGSAARNSTFTPATNPAPGPGLTEYEKIAQNGLQPYPTSSATPSNPSGFQPASDASGFRPPSAGNLTSTTPAQQPASSFAQSTTPKPPMNEGSSNRYPNTGAFQPQSQVATTQPPTNTGLQPIVPERPISTITPSTNTGAAQVNYEYPTTPFKPFPSRVAEAVDSVTNATQQSVNQLVAPVEKAANNAVQATTNVINQAVDAVIPPLPNNVRTTQPSTPTLNATTTVPKLQLQLQGQGSYAPGSVRTPTPYDPSRLQAPSNQSEGSGGSFKP